MNLLKDEVFKNGISQITPGEPQNTERVELESRRKLTLNSRVSKKAVSSLGSGSSHLFAHYVGIIRGPFWIPLLTPSNVDLKQSNSQLFYK